MKCSEFAKIVHELARSEGLTETEAAAARAHSVSCPSCARRLAEAEELAALFRSVSSECRSLETPEGAEPALMAAFRAAKSGQSRRRKPRWQPLWGWASAAAVALLLAFAMFGGSPVRRSQPGSGSNLVNASGTLAQADTTSSIPATGSSHAAVQPISGFVPVPFAGGFARGDSGVIVRVQLPRSALAELGYPADQMQDQGTVQADLLVGEDGWPRAVRIVKETSEQ